MKKLLVVMVVLLVTSFAYAELTELEKAKIAYSDANINLEIAQGRYNEAKTKLIQELQKPSVVEVKQEKTKK
jgi:hypothetical protein